MEIRVASVVSQLDNDLATTLITGENARFVRPQSLIRARNVNVLFPRNLLERRIASLRGIEA